MAARSCLRLLLLPAAVFLGLLSPACAASHILFNNDCLYPGQYLSYRNYVLILQRDCNFVLYDSGRWIWSSGTGGRASYCYMRMQSDGNLVIYDGRDEPLWASNSARGHGFYVLMLQDDRNVVIYGGGAIWATATNPYGAGAAVEGALAAAGNETLPSAVVVNADQGGEAGPL